MDKPVKDIKAISRQKKALFADLVKRSGLKTDDILMLAMEQFIVANIDMVTEEDKVKYDKLIFS